MAHPGLENVKREVVHLPLFELAAQKIEADEKVLRHVEAVRDVPAVGLYAGMPGFKGKATSAEAARGIARAVGQKQRQVLEAIRKRGPGGATVFELMADLDWVQNTVAPRCTELSRADPPLIRDSGLTRKSPGGSSYTVWVVA